MSIVKHKSMFYKFYCGHQPAGERNIVMACPKRLVASEESYDVYVSIYFHMYMLNKAMFAKGL